MGEPTTLTPGALIRDDGRSIAGFWAGRSVFRYIYRPDVPASESPKPYFHPLCSLDGATLTDFQPDDHPWHHGLSMTLTLVDDHNFWGGPTYRREDGYRDRSNQGRQDHAGWVRQMHSRHFIALEQALDWRTAAGQGLLSEARAMTFDFSDADAGWYTLSFASRLSNVSGRPLRLDTYASASGLTGSPYTGLQFRGRRGFLDRQNGFTPRIFAGDQIRDEAEIHAERWPWMAITGKLAQDPESTLIFCDDPRNPRHPNVFFLRPDNAQVAFSFVGDRSVTLRAGEDLELRYRILIGSGAWTEREIVERANTQLKTSPSQR